MAASFPATLWTWTDQIDNTSAMDAADVNSPAAEIIAIETYLGAGSIVSGQLILNSAAGVDPWVSLQINSVEKFRIVVDDSDSDKLKIHTGAAADPSLWEMSSTGHIELTNVAETASDPGRHLYLQRIHTGAVGSGKGLTGVEVRSTFDGSADALTAEVKGGEFKARHTTGNTYDVGTFKGVIGNVDVKNGTVTTGWAVEGAIDVSSGGTFTTAACFHGNLNNSGTVTSSYGVYVHGLSGYTLTRGLYVDYATTGIYLDNCTTDIRLQDGATIVNAATNGGTLTVTEDNIVLVGGGWGKIAFGGYTDWGTGATGTDIDGTGYDWVTSTVGHVDSGALAAACAASYDALTIVATSHSTASSFFGVWSELYIKNSVDLTNAANVASVWGHVEAGTGVTLSDSGDFTCGVYADIVAGSTLTIASGHSCNGFRAQAEISAVTNNGTLAAFECLKNGGVDWEYGLYIADAATGINITACTTAAINIETAQITGINIAGAMTTAGINIVGGTAAGHAILVGSSTTGIQVDGTPDYAVEVYADIATGAQSLANVGSFNSRTTIAAASVITSTSYITASYNRMEIEGGNTDLGTPWVTAILGYFKNPSGTCDATSATCSAINGLVNVGADYTDGAASWTSAYVAASYSNASATIPRYPAYLVVDLGLKEFTHGFYCADSAAAIGMAIGTCTTAIDLIGTITEGIDFGSATLTSDASRENSFIKCGTYTTQKEMTPTDQAYLFQMNVQIMADLTSDKRVIGHYNKLETGAALTATRLKVNENYCVVGHAVKDAHVVYGELYYASGYTEGGVSNEGFGGAFTVDTNGGSTPTGLLYAIKARIKGTNLNTAGFAHCAAFFVTENSTFTNTRFTNLSGATITNMIDSNQAGTCTNFIALNGAFTNLWNFDAASGFITSGGTDCTDSGAADPAYTAKVITPDGNAGYIRIWGAA